jgi:hypothetical protein
VELFEAMLHRVSPARESASTFLTRPVRLRDAAASAQTDVTVGNHDDPTHACVLLALEWLRCAAASRPESSVRVSTPVVQAIAAMRGSQKSAPSHSRALLVLGLEAAGSPHGINLSVPLAADAFARHLTGAFGERDGTRHELLSLTTDLFRAEISILPVDPECAQSTPAGARGARPGIAPRVLTDEGMPGALVNYRSGDGMVCVLFQQHESVVVTPNGTTRPHNRWPRPIVNELSFGEGGAVAWGDGLSTFPDRIESGYVMYKHRPDAEIVIQDLPIRPTIGRWWNGRLYWNCHPRRIKSPTGLYSWAPGEAPKPELPDLPATLGMHSDEEGLRFEPGGGPLQGGRWQRRFQTCGWSWRPGTELRPIDLGRYGAVSARDASGVWTATAHPEADLVRLESADGCRLSMTCYYPIGVGWLGDSLLVGTIELELLLFENLSTWLGVHG